MQIFSILLIGFISISAVTTGWAERFIHPANQAKATANTVEDRTKARSQQLQRKGGRVIKKTQQQIVEKINLNRADTNTLQRGLRGVGPKYAERIVNYRNQLPRKRFTSVDQLREVQGVPRRVVDAIQDQVRL